MSERWGKIVHVSEVRRLDQRGDVQVFYRYESLSRGGIPFTVDIPEAETNEKGVAARLPPRAAELDKTLGV